MKWSCRIRSNKTVFSFVVSYVIVLLIPLCLSIAFLSTARANLRAKVAQVNEAVLTQAMQNTQSVLDAALNTLFRLSESGNIQKLMYIEPPFSSLNRLAIYEAMRDDLGLAGAATLTGCSYHIYFARGGFVLNHEARYTPLLAYSELFSAGNLSYEAFFDLIQGRHAREIVDVGDALLLMQSYPYTGGTPAANMFAILPKRSLAALSAQNEWIASGTFMVTDSLTNALFGWETAECSFADLARDAAVSGPETIYRATAEGDYGLRYALAVHEGYVSGSENALNDAYLFFLAAALILGLILAMTFSNRNYRPIRRIVRTIESAHPQENVDRQDELTYIDLSVQKILSDNAEMREQVLARNEYMRRAYLSQILRGRVRAAELNEESLADHLLKFDREYLCVFLMAAQDGEGLDYSATFLLAERMNRAWRAYVCETREYVACVVNFSEIAEMEEIVRDFRLAQDELSRRLAVEIRAVRSNPHTSLAGLHNGFEEARYAIELVSREKFRVYSAPDAEAEYGFSGDMERALARAVKSGDRDETQRILNEIFSVAPGVRLNVMRYVAFEVEASLLRLREGMGLWDDSANAMRSAEAINALHDAQEIVWHLETIAEPALARAESLENSHCNQLIERITAFVDQHYGEESLSNTVVAEAMGISTAYLSRIFKQNTGEGLLDYISGVRVARACHAFEQCPSISVKDVCDRVGYGNLTTFTRVFKKHTGVTPGQYRARGAGATQHQILS